MRTKLLVVLSLISVVSCATAQPTPTPAAAGPGTTPYPPPPAVTARPNDPLPSTRLDADALTCSKPGSAELNAFYLTHRPPRALYFFRILRSPQKPSFIVIIRANESKNLPEKVRSPHLPAVEKIIGPIETERDWHIVFAYLRTYAVAPPAGNYCWEDDCYGFFNRRFDNNEGDFPPAPGQNPPDWPPVTGMVVSIDPSSPYGSRDVERRVRMALAGAQDAQIDLVTLQSQPAPSATKGAPCPNEVTERLPALKEQAAKIVQVASPSPASK